MKKSRARSASSVAETRPRAAADMGARVAFVALALVLFGTPFVVDTGAESSFEAPKRLWAFVGIAIAAAALFAWPRDEERPRGDLWTSGLFAAAMVLALVSALASPHRAASLDAFRRLALYALLLPIGASRRLAPHGRTLLGVSLMAWALTALVSIVQATAGLRLFAIETLGGRQDTWAFVGNEGYLALMAGVAAVACLALAVVAPRPERSRVVIPLLLLFLTAIAVNRSLTAPLTLASGAAVVAFVRFRGRAFAVGAALVVLLAASVVAVPALRQRAAWIGGDLRAGNWNAVPSFRLGAWGAALEMVRERPLLGFGPGTFAAEFVPHRLHAEIRHRARLTSPASAGSYSEAHSDYLQALAEGGIPATVAAVAAIALLFARLWRRARAPASADQAEAALLAALVAAFAVAALTWFPTQRALSVVPLLLVLGRGWRLTS